MKGNESNEYKLVEARRTVSSEELESDRFALHTLTFLRLHSEQPVRLRTDLLFVEPGQLCEGITCAETKQGWLTCSLLTLSHVMIHLRCPEGGLKLAPSSPGLGTKVAAPPSLRPVI